MYDHFIQWHWMKLLQGTWTSSGSSERRRKNHQTLFSSQFPAFLIPCKLANWLNLRFIWFLPGTKRDSNLSRLVIISWEMTLHEDWNWLHYKIQSLKIDPIRKPNFCPTRLCSNSMISFMSTLYNIIDLVYIKWVTHISNRKFIGSDCSKTGKKKNSRMYLIKA